MGGSNEHYLVNCKKKSLKCFLGYEHLPRQPCLVIDHLDSLACHFFVILYINPIFLKIFLLSANVSHPVSSRRDCKEAKLGRPVTIRAAFS